MVVSESLTFNEFLDSDCCNQPLNTNESFREIAARPKIHINLNEFLCESPAVIFFLCPRYYHVKYSCHFKNYSFVALNFRHTFLETCLMVVFFVTHFTIDHGWIIKFLHFFSSLFSSSSSSAVGELSHKCFY